MERPHWHVVVATDDARTLDLTINVETGQLFLAVIDSQRMPTHVATFNRKTKALANLIDSLLEADQVLGEGPDGIAPPPELAEPSAPQENEPLEQPRDYVDGEGAAP